MTPTPITTGISAGMAMWRRSCRRLPSSTGRGTSLEDFERKAQLMNYVSYRAIFEGFQAHLWTRNSGRLLWMTHPSWPSNTWQIYSSDYDTGAAITRSKSMRAGARAAEPAGLCRGRGQHHTSRSAGPGSAKPGLVIGQSPAGERVEHVDANANATTTSKPWRNCRAPCGANRWCWPDSR